MRFLILLVFVGVPLAEIALLIQVGGVIGALPTVALVVATAVAGVALIRLQGVGVLRRARLALDAGELPVGAVFDGVCLLIAGALLLTPGLITDAVGFLLLAPGFRRWMASWSLGRLERSLRGRAFRAGRSDGGPPGGAPPVIDGEFERLDPEAPPPRGGRPGPPSGWRIDP